MLLQVSSNCRDSAGGMSFEKMYGWAQWRLERFEEETFGGPCFSLSTEHSNQERPCGVNSACEPEIATPPTGAPGHKHFLRPHRPGWAGTAPSPAPVMGAQAAQDRQFWFPCRDRAMPRPTSPMSVLSVSHAGTYRGFGWFISILQTFRACKTRQKIL